LLRRYMEDRKRDLLQRAVQLYGHDNVAVQLGITSARLDAWIAGTAEMPDGKLLVLAAIIDRLAREQRR
jgi:hypothetical protein